MTKILRWPSLIVLATLFLILLATGFVELFLWASGQLGLHHALGMDTQTSENYASVSGVLPMIVTALGFSGLLLTAWHHLNCHQDGCWKIARYPVAGGKYKTCRPHNPDENVKAGLKAHHLQAAHEDYGKTAVVP